MVNPQDAYFYFVNACLFSCSNNFPVCAKYFLFAVFKIVYLYGCLLFSSLLIHQ